MHAQPLEVKLDKYFSCFDITITERWVWSRETLYSTNKLMDFSNG